MSEFLEIAKNKIFTTCPNCGAPHKPKEVWPEGSLHAFSVPYECGAVIAYPIGYDGAVWIEECTK